MRVQQIGETNALDLFACERRFDVREGGARILVTPDFGQDAAGALRLPVFRQPARTLRDDQHAQEE